MQDKAIGPGEEASGQTSATPQGEPRLLSDDAFAALLLRALAEMAGRSKRRQADLTAALHRAGLPAEPARVRAALRQLLAQGRVTGPVPLSDGGLLLTVPASVGRPPAESPQWLPMAEDG